MIIAHVQVASADPLLATHYRFQIRTFWIGILYLVVGTILTVVIVGIAILFWWFVWSLVRNVKRGYEGSADAVKEGIDRVREVDVDEYVKPLRKHWKKWMS